MPQAAAAIAITAMAITSNLRRPDHADFVAAALLAVLRLRFDLATRGFTTLLRREQSSSNRVDGVVIGFAAPGPSLQRLRIDAERSSLDLHGCRQQALRRGLRMALSDELDRI